MSLPFVPLEDDVYDAINRLAEQEQRTVSALVNEALREFLGRQEQDPAEACS